MMMMPTTTVLITLSSTAASSGLLASSGTHKHKHAFISFQNSQDISSFLRDMYQFVYYFRNSLTTEFENPCHRSDVLVLLADQTLGIQSHQIQTLKKTLRGHRQVDQ